MFLRDVLSAEASNCHIYDVALNEIYVAESCSGAGGCSMQMILTLCRWNEREHTDEKSRSAPCWTGSQWRSWLRGSTAHEDTVNILASLTLTQAHCSDSHKQANDSLGHLCSLRRAPPPLPASARRIQSERPGRAATLPGSSAGLSGTAACPDPQDNTVTSLLQITQFICGNLLNLS